MQGRCIPKAPMSFKKQKKTWNHIYQTEVMQFNTSHLEKKQTYIFFLIIRQTLNSQLENNKIKIS